MKYFDFNDKTKILFNVVGFLFLMLIIILMNKNKISDKVYGIRKVELIKKNIIASVIGIMITITLALSKI